MSSRSLLEPVRAVAPTSVPRLLERRRTAWRAPLAAASLVTAAAHVPVTGEHLREAPYIGVLFVLLEVAAVLLALALLRPPPRLVLLAIAVVGGLAVLALLASRVVGLPLIGDDVGNWAEPLALVSLAAESLMVVGGLAAATSTARSTARARRIGVIGGLVVLLAGSMLIGASAAAVAAGGGAEGSGGSVHGHGTGGTETGGHVMDGHDMGGMEMDGHDMGGMDMDGHG